MLRGDFAAALADRNAGVWRPPPDGAAAGGLGGARGAAGGNRAGRGTLTADRRREPRSGRAAERSRPCPDCRTAGPPHAGSVG